MNTVPNEAFLPSSDNSYSVIDALINSPILATGTYLAGTATGVNGTTLDKATIIASQLSDIGSSLILSKLNLSPVLGQTSANVANGFVPIDPITLKALNQAVFDEIPQGVNVTVTYATKLNKDILANNPKYDAPYQSGTKTYTYQTPVSDDTFVRVYTGTASLPEGNWLMRASDIQGLSPAQIQAKYALPWLPTNIVDVTIPANQTIRASTSASALGNVGGGVQFEVISNIQSS